MTGRVGVLVVLVGLACTGGAGEEAASAPAATAPAPEVAAPASSAGAKARGRKARGRGGKAGGGGSCCEQGPGTNGLPVDATIWEDIDQGECTTNGGKWVTKPECELVCCAIGDGSDTEPVPELVPKGSCRFVYLAWAGEVRPAEQCP